MKKVFNTKFLAAGLMALSFGLTGCLTDSKDDDSLKITSQPVSVTAALGDSISISVVASGPGPIKYKWIATKGSENNTLSDSTATLKTKLTSDLTGFALKVVVYNSTDTVESAYATITVTYKAVGDTLTLGAQANASLGSVIDLDSGKVWSSATANANQSKIDLVYLYYNNTATLNGASAARDSGIKYSINLTNTYNSAQVKNIQLVRTTSKPISLAAAATTYATGPSVRSAVIAAGDKFIVKSSEDVYHYVEVRSVTGTTAGTAGLTFFVGEL